MEGGATYANVKQIMLDLMIAELPNGAFEPEDAIFARGQLAK